MPRSSCSAHCLIAVLLASAGTAAAADTPPPAAAEKPRALVLSVSFRGDGPPITEAARATVNGYLDAALDSLGFLKVDDGARDAMLDADGGKLRDCLSTLACKVALADRLNAGMALSVDLVRAEIPVEEPAAATPAAPEPKHAQKHKNGKESKQITPAPAAPHKPRTVEQWRLEVALYPMDVKTEGATAVSDAPCASFEEIRTGLLSVLGKALAEERARARGTLRIASTPPGAAVLIDDKPAGQTGATDLVRAVYAGKHHVRVQLDEVREQDLDVTPNSTLRFVADFSHPAPSTNCPTRGQKIMRVLGPLLLVAGAGVAGYGAYALSQSGALTDCADPANPKSCMSRVTSTGGIAAVAPGAAAVLTGAILTGVGWKKCKAPAVSFAPVVAPGLTAGSLSIDF